MTLGIGSTTSVTVMFPNCGLHLTFVQSVKTVTCCLSVYFYCVPLHIVQNCLCVFICGVCVFPPPVDFSSVYCIVYYFRCLKRDFGSHFVSSPSHPVGQVAFHVSDLSTCIYILILLITTTFILDSSTSRQMENLMVTVWRKWRLQFDDSTILSSFPS